MRVLGVDGCRGGWVAVALEDGVFAGSRYVLSIGELVLDTARVIGVDTPLGETVPGDRAADRSARTFLAPRSSLVFPAPLFAALETRSREEGSALSYAQCKKRIGSTAWGLRKYMLDARSHWNAAPQRIREVHPECSFRAMAGRSIASKKKDWSGLRERLALLTSHGIDVLADRHDLPTSVPPQDVVDAAAAAWSANRLALGIAQSLPDPPERDEAGREVAIWY